MAYRKEGLTFDDEALTIIVVVKVHDALPPRPSTEFSLTISQAVAEEITGSGWLTALGQFVANALAIKRLRKLSPETL